MAKADKYHGRLIMNGKEATFTVSVSPILPLTLKSYLP